MSTSVKQKMGYLFAGLLVLTSLIAIYLYFFKLGYIEIIPERTMSTSSVSAKVEVYRDQYGVPHIYGETLEDIFFASGYTMGEDRLFQIEMTVRAASGRMAEILGEDLIEVDKKARQKGYTDKEIQAMINGMPADAQRAYASMVAGINHYVSEALTNPDEKLPIEFAQMGIALRPYEPSEIMSAISLILRIFGASGGTELTNQAFLVDMAEQYGMESAKVIFNDILPLTDLDAYASVASWEAGNSAPSNELSNLRLTPFSKTGKEELAAYLAGEQSFAQNLRDIGISFGASRTIVVGAEKSATGNPLMMQGTADGSEIHLVGPDFDFAGLNINPVGMPVMGRGKDIGVLITTGERDTRDIFTVQIAPDDKYTYRYKNDWHKMDVRTETIHVKKQESVSYVVARTVHGPVMMWDEEAGVAHSMKWAMWAQDANVWASALQSMKVKTAKEFLDVLPTIASSSSNITYADAGGNIGFRHMGDLPARSKEADPRLPARGDGSEDWSGFLPASASPVKFNPEEGYSVAWNNNPAPGTVYGDASRWGKHFRIFMPVDYLESKEKVSIEDLMTLNRRLSETFFSVNLNFTSPHFFKPFFEEVIATTQNKKLAEAARLMTQWDGIFTDADEDGFYDHPGALLFPTWRKVALETVFQDDIGDWWHKLDDNLYIPYRTSLLIRAFEGKAAANPFEYDYFNGKARANVMLKTLQVTLDRLANEYTAENLSDWHQAVYWRHMAVSDRNKKDKNKVLPGRAMGYNGAGVPFRYLPHAIVDHGQPEWTAIMEISEDKPYYYSAVPSGGQSWFINQGWKASPHINDQYKLHRDGAFKMVALDRETIVNERESLLIITPN